MSILSLFGITDAFAQSGAAPHSGGLMSVLPMFIILGLFMYLMIIRPQSKRVKQHKALVGNLQKGDEIVTTGGIVGKIEKINDDFIILNIAENITITIQKNSVVNCLPKGTIKTTK